MPHMNNEVPVHRQCQGTSSQVYLKTLAFNQAFQGFKPFYDFFWDIGATNPQNDTCPNGSHLPTLKRNHGRAELEPHATTSHQHSFLALSGTGDRNVRGPSFQNAYRRPIRLATMGRRGLIEESSPKVSDERAARDRVWMHEIRDSSLNEERATGRDGREGSTGASGTSDHTEVGAKSQDASGEVTRNG